RRKNSKTRLGGARSGFNFPHGLPPPGSPPVSCQPARARTQIHARAQRRIGVNLTEGEMRLLVFPSPLEGALLAFPAPEILSAPSRRDNQIRAKDRLVPPSER